MINENCPSYDSGYCLTSPTPYCMRCEDLENCKWKDFDFTNEELLNKELEGGNEKK